MSVLSVCIPVYLFIYLSVCLSIYLYVCLSIYVFVYQSIYLFFIRFVYISVSLSIYLYVCLSIYVKKSICLSIYVQHLPHRSRVIRVMPNMPAIVQSGASVLSRGQFADEKDGHVVQQLLQCIGTFLYRHHDRLTEIYSRERNGPECIMSICA